LVVKIADSVEPLTAERKASSRLLGTRPESMRHAYQRVIAKMPGIIGRTLQLRVVLRIADRPVGAFLPDRVAIEQIGLKLRTLAHREGQAQREGVAIRFVAAAVQRRPIVRIAGRVLRPARAPDRRQKLLARASDVPTFIERARDDLTGDVVAGELVDRPHALQLCLADLLADIVAGCRRGRRIRRRCQRFVALARLRKGRRGRTRWCGIGSRGGSVGASTIRGGQAGIERLGLGLRRVSSQAHRFKELSQLGIHGQALRLGLVGADFRSLVCADRGERDFPCLPFRSDAQGPFARGVLLAFHVGRLTGGNVDKLDRPIADGRVADVLALDLLPGSLAPLVRREVQPAHAFVACDPELPS
jgi:hypothetical protein